MHTRSPRSGGWQKPLAVFFTGLDLILAAVIITAFISRTAESVIIDNPVSTPVSDSYRMIFTGDIMLDRLVEREILRQQDPLYPFLRIASYLQEADITIGNLEGPISDRGVNQGSIYSFRFEPTGTLNALRYAGFDIVSLANNHIWDWGRDALTDTMNHLMGLGINFVGAGFNYADANKPVIKILGDTRVAFLGFTDLYPEGLEADETLGISDFEAAHEIVKNLKTAGSADIITVLLHWGVEYETESTLQQREFARSLIDAGADLVIGHHPHVAQEIEQYKNGYIAYSLGNFVFDQDFSQETMEGLLIEVTVKDKNVVGFKPVPIKISPTYQPYLVEDSSL